MVNLVTRCQTRFVFSSKRGSLGQVILALEISCFAQPKPAAFVLTARCFFDQVPKP